MLKMTNDIRFNPKGTLERGFPWGRLICQIVFCTTTSLHLSYFSYSYWTNFFGIVFMIPNTVYHSFKRVFLSYYLLALLIHRYPIIWNIRCPTRKSPFWRSFYVKLHVINEFYLSNLWLIIYNWFYLFSFSYE